jgi:SAM-dependent methyltransferase
MAKIPRFVGKSHSFDAAAVDYGSRPDYPADFYGQLHRRIGHGGSGMILDLGCGDARLAQRLAGWGHQVLALDLSAQMLAAARTRLDRLAPSRVHLVHGHAENLPILPESAEAVTIGQAFHWMRPDPVAREIARVLKPRGLWVIFWIQPQTPLSLSAQIADAQIAEVLPDYDPQAARQLDSRSRIPAHSGFLVHTWQTVFACTYRLEEYAAMTASKSYVAASLSSEGLDQFKLKLLRCLEQSQPDLVVTERYLLTAYFAKRGGQN